MYLFWWRQNSKRVAHLVLKTPLSDIIRNYHDGSFEEVQVCEYVLEKIVLNKNNKNL